MKIIKISIVILGLTMFFFSCKKDVNIVPDLPPEASFITNFSDFNISKSNNDLTNINWKYAAGNVLVWNSIITVGLAVPVASYTEAFKNNDPVYQGDGTWLWEYSFPQNENTYTARLFGTVNDNSIYWEMFISKDGEYDSFKWFSGISIDNSKVSWVLFDNPIDANELLSIEYIKTSDNSGSITYKNIVPEGSENGGYIKYENNNSDDLNAYYEIYNKGKDNLTEIEWSQTNKNGRVKDENKYQDDKWYCWNENLEDIDCN